MTAQSSFVLSNFEPTQITAGDNVQWLRKFSAYPPASFTLSYTAMPTTGAAISIVATTYSDNMSFWVNVAGSVTATWAASDNYLLQAYITDSTGNRQTLYTSPLKIKPNFATASVQNYQSAVKQTLDALYALVQGKASSDQMHYSIKGRSLSRMTPKEILDWIDFYEELYDRELRTAANLQGKPNRGKITAHFKTFDASYLPQIFNKIGG